MSDSTLNIGIIANSKLVFVHIDNKARRALGIGNSKVQKNNNPSFAIIPPLCWTQIQNGGLRKIERFILEFFTDQPTVSILNFLYRGSLQDINTSAQSPRGLGNFRLSLEIPL